MPSEIQILNWDEHYETSSTRKLVRLRWVPFPNSMGLGYARLMQRHGYAGLGVWGALLQIASRKPRDRRDGLLEYTLEDLALESRGDLPILREVLPTLREIGWIALETGPATTAGESATSVAESAGRREGKGIEGKGIEGNGTVAAKPPRTHSPREQLARDLAKALGSSLNPCRKQVAALLESGWPLDDIRAHLADAMPGMAPWDWTKRITGAENERKDGGLSPTQIARGDAFK